ncbi:MAG: formylglycine-generating enzyme family protein [Sedimentisphaerales bacterium]|nr:formylglycine-generating enzyme family protein [Sedimentisphaerales bacterium]
MQSSYFTLAGGLIIFLLFLCLRLSGVSDGGESTASQTADSDAKKTRITELDKSLSFDLGDGVKLELVQIPAGSFMMGDEQGQGEEKPVHKVTLSRPFYLGRFEVTQQQWKTVMGRLWSHFPGEQNPVDRVSWQHCQEFIAKLNETFADEGVTFFLPTEAQWEYACRAGASGPYGFGNDPTKLSEYAWFEANAEGKTHPVGEKKPNAWGLYDMHGNVLEWCADWYGEDYYKQSPATDPAGPAEGSHRILRGGSWSDGAFYCRSTTRYCLPPWFCVYCYGFRVACTR